MDNSDRQLLKAALDRHSRVRKIKLALIVGTLLFVGFFFILLEIVGIN